MGTKTTASIIAYLRSLAPEFFAARMRGASEVEILHLEKVAGLRMSDGHREFLRAMGKTPARVLNPFLNDRDFCVATLVTEYEYLRKEATDLPPGVVYFSSSEITGSNIFLRHGADSSDDPEIGEGCLHLSDRGVDLGRRGAADSRRHMMFAEPRAARGDLVLGARQFGAEADRLSSAERIRRSVRFIHRGASAIVDR